jgi:hypothetical protein
MKAKGIILVMSLTLMFLFGACDKIETPMKEGAAKWTGRKIIIYDFTGQQCGNCPAAHGEIKKLIDLYGEAIVPIAIHCSHFATPDNGYPYDFRTDIGDYLGGKDHNAGFYGQLSLPCGLINNLSGTNISLPSKWAEETTKFIQLYSEFSMYISAESSTNNISCEVFVKTEIKNKRKLNLVAFLLEDNIIQNQKDLSKEPDKIPDYEHNHVLRAGFNGAWGEEIKSNTNELAIGEEFRKSYSITIPKDKDWNTENCSVVAFVYDTDTKEILQAEKIHLHE